MLVDYRKISRDKLIAYLAHWRCQVETVGVENEMIFFKRVAWPLSFLRTEREEKEPFSSFSS